MAVTIQADPDLANFNCFITLANAELYHETRLFNSNWSGADAPTKNIALVWATRQLCTLSWRGVQTSGTQDLCLPRKGLSYVETSASTDYGNSELYDSGLGDFQTTVVIADDTIPDAVQDATAELALFLLEKDITAPTGTEGFKKISVDTIKLELDAKDRQSWFNASVRNLIWRFLANNSAFNVPTQRVG